MNSSSRPSPSKGHAQSREAGLETAPHPPRRRLSKLLSLEGRPGRSGREDAKWGRLFAVSGGGILVACDERLRIVYHNGRFSGAIGGPCVSYRGTPLGGFFPESDRETLLGSFGALMEGRCASLAFEGALLTRGRPLAVAGHAARGLESGRRHLFLTIREQSATAPIPSQEATASFPSPVRNELSEGLPVAIFRTDRELRLVYATGELWDVFQTDPSSLVGGSLVDPGCHLVPPFLHEVDYCDTMAGLTLQADLSWRGADFVLTVEPFVDENMKVVGTLGILRMAKRIDSSKGVDHLLYPRPEDYTQAIKLPRSVALAPVRETRPPAPAPAPAPSSTNAARPVAKTAPASKAPQTAPSPAVARSHVLPVAADEEDEDWIASLRRRIRPRSLTSEDFREVVAAPDDCRMGDGSSTRQVTLPS